MKLLFDNNLSVRLPEIVLSGFSGSKHVCELNIAQFSDREIWDYAAKNDFCIITKDKDFYYLSTTLGQPPKVIWLLTGNCRNKTILDLIIQNIQQIEDFLSDKRDILILR